MANPVFPLATVQQEPEEELEERKMTQKPTRLKQCRTSAKRLHTMSLNRVLLAVQTPKDVDQVKILQAVLVRDYDVLVQIQHHFMEICKFDSEKLDRETRWADDIASKHSKTLVEIANHLESHQAHARSVAGSSHSGTSYRSSASATRLKLQEAERLEKETQLKIQQERAEAIVQAAEEQRMQQLEAERREEEERMQQLKIAIKAEEKHIEAARNERQSQMELEKQRFISSLLRQQLADELVGETETASAPEPRSLRDTSAAPFVPLATPSPKIRPEYASATPTARR